MIHDVTKFLAGIAIGIRFGPSFAVTDDLGDIADRILHKNGSYFDEKMFPFIGETPLEMKLYNAQSGDSLLINSRDIVLTCNLDNSGLILDPNIKPRIKVDALAEIQSRFERDIVKDVLAKYKSNPIRRVGYINRYIFSLPKLPQRFVDKTIGQTITGVTDMMLRFSRKYPVPSAIVQKDVNDYHNVIFSIAKSAEKDEAFVSVDYQAYYDPPLESLRNDDFPHFLDSMHQYNTKTFPEWLNQQFGEPGG